jgi:multidrug resistance efflux pump
MGTNLEHELGQLNGQLKALVPALERQEERMRQADLRAAGAEARLEALRKEFDEYKAKTANRIGELYKKAETAAAQIALAKGMAANAQSDVDALGDPGVGIAAAKAAAEKAQADVDAVKAARSGIGKKVWDIVKIVLGAILGGWFAWWLSGRKP